MSGPMEAGENRGAGGSAGSRNNGLAKELFWFALPLILSGLLQQLYNIVDSLIIGNVLGEEALAAAGASGPILNLFIYVCTGLVTGCTILVSHAWGAGERKKATAVAATFGLFLLAGSLALAGIGLCLHRGLLSLLHTPEALLAGASEYLSVVFLGIPFLALYNLAGALLRGTGNSRTPLVAIILASLVNVGLDLLLVWGVEWGIRGAAVGLLPAVVSAPGERWLLLHAVAPGGQQGLPGRRAEAQPAAGHPIRGQLPGLFAAAKRDEFLWRGCGGRHHHQL